MLTEKQLMHIEETAQVKDHKPYPDNAVELGSDVVMMMVEEIREYRDYQTETRPIVERVHEYTQKHGLLGWGNVIDALLADAERLRAVVAQQATEIEALRGAGLGLLDLIDHEGLNNGGANGVTGGDRWDIDEGMYMTERLIESCRKTLNSDAALDAKPDAAPAPVENPIKVGDRVRVTKEGSINKGRIGRVVSVNLKISHPYDVEFPEVVGHSMINVYTRNEIEPA